MKNDQKHPFDYSGPSIWSQDPELKMINVGKLSGQKRREQMRRTEPQYEPPNLNKRVKK